ncbi:unnamed protein product [Echinostoma caproni]|uniref:Midasin n=1 Tax=Echinostoma caproni TaxID=27848 RepID=A0A183AVA8_9TREM|nr:unnamed protein product [Echinostoma caproni]
MNDYFGYSFSKNYCHGQSDETCLNLLPSDALCSYVLSVCKLVTGRFVDAVKAAAPVLSRWVEPKVSSSAEFIHLNYLKEWARYLHSHFTQPMIEFHWLSDLSNQFKQYWVQSVPLESVVRQTVSFSLSACPRIRFVEFLLNVVRLL